MKSGWFCDLNFLQDEQLPQAMTPDRFRQFIAAATPSAKRRLPTPSGPRKSKACGIRPAIRDRLNIRLAFSCPKRPVKQIDPESTIGPDPAKKETAVD